MSRKVWVLQHAECETLGLMERVFEEKQITYDYIRTFAGQPVPQTFDSVSGLVVMGGPMGVYEEAKYPFLKEEKRLIELALKQKKPILGVCLGSQLLASVLGAPVKKGVQKEIGWAPVEFTSEAKKDSLLCDVPSSFIGFHWHGDFYPLPQGAVKLASSALTPIQAFSYNKKAYGFLFHMEVTDQMIQSFVKTFSQELESEKIDSSVILNQMKSLVSLQEIGHLVFTRWAGLLNEKN